MKCAKCGAELKLGSIYCSSCGQEAQIVSDSSLLEEELLRQLLKEEEMESGKKDSQNHKKSQKLKKKRSHAPLIISLSCLVVLIGIAAALILVIRNNRYNSYDYQVQQAQAYAAENDYSKALMFYERALELSEDDLKLRQEMVDVYLAMKADTSAIHMLHEIISIDAGNVEAYQMLIRLYEQKKDYDAVVKLMEGVQDERLLDLFTDYMVQPPEFSLKPGKYSDYITVELTAPEDCEIYYTINGSDPLKEGRLYEKPFVLEEQGTLEIRMCACNRYGIYSNEVKGKYTVAFQKPKMAKATPDRGSFVEPTTIELTGPEGSRMYYTWDGTNPTVDSTPYTEPIPVPEGNNILSVILIDKYGTMSDVLKCNYEYFPLEQ